jgi:hypothetical protein
MTKGNKTDESQMMSNEVLRGKPYLDIDRVITEGEAKGRSSEGKDNK